MIELSNALRKSAIAVLDAEMALMEDAWTKLIRNTSETDRALFSRDQVDFGTVRGQSQILHIELM